MTVDRRVVPFKRWHYDWLTEQDAAEGLTMAIGAQTLTVLERSNSWTGVVDGTPVVCAGTLEQWPGRHIAWAYMARGTLPHMTWITMAVLNNLAKVKGRIELTVRADFRVGQRWARRLGFEVETPRLAAFGPQGEDHVGFVRIN